jgi:conjugative transfer signal peptidase TraF
METPERLYPARSGAAVRAAVGVEGEEVRGSASVVRQGKGSVVPHHAAGSFLTRLKRFSHDARIIRAHHIVWSESGRERGADEALPQCTQRWRTRFVVPVVAAGVLAIAVGVAFLSARSLGLRITLSDSAAAAGIYRLTPSPGERGELVAACLPAVIARQGLTHGYLHARDCPAGAEPVAKVVGAVGGDTLQIEPGWVAVNGKRFANSRTAEQDSRGRPLAHGSFGTRKVATSEVWLFGFNDARSWDARYFGPVPKANVRGLLQPVLTW